MMPSSQQSHKAARSAVSEFQESYVPNAGFYVESEVVNAQGEYYMLNQSELTDTPTESSHGILGQSSQEFTVRASYSDVCSNSYCNIPLSSSITTNNFSMSKHHCDELRVTDHASSPLSTNADSLSEFENEVNNGPPAIRQRCLAFMFADTATSSDLTCRDSATLSLSSTNISANTRRVDFNHDDDSNRTIDMRKRDKSNSIPLLGIPPLIDHYIDDEESANAQSPTMPITPTIVEPTTVYKHCGVHDSHTASNHHSSAPGERLSSLLDHQTRGESPTPHDSNDRSTSVGIAAYIQEELIDPTPASTSSTPITKSKATQSSKRRHNTRSPPTAPWYCVSRSISEQTKDIKIQSVNRSSSIYFSRVLEKCRSILEYCTLQGDTIELTEANISEMNFNHNWGDSIPANSKGKTIRVVYQNVQRSISASDNPLTNSLLDNLNNMDADIFMASETNVNWKSATFRNDFQARVRRVWPASKFSFSSSDVGLEFEFSERLPGGTCTLAMDNLSMRVVKAGEDASGLGRWSYLTLEGQGGRKLTFITAYRICRGAMKGTSTSCRQQEKVNQKAEMKQGIAASSIDTAFLREKFITDLILFIKSLQEEGHAIVLGLDANETPEESLRNGTTRPGSISWLLEQTGLEEVFESRHNTIPDSSTTTPGRFIDRVAVFGIPIQRVAILKAHMPAKSDHLGIVVDLDLHYLFNNACSPLAKSTPRKLTSGNQAAVNKYVAFIKKQFDEHRIVDRCNRLKEAIRTDTFNESHRAQLFALDNQVTEILLGAENQCSKKRVERNLWSPALQKAGKEICYWKRRLSTNGAMDEGTKELGESLHLPASIQQPMTIPLCEFYLDIARKTYRGIQAQAKIQRENFLKQLAKERAAKGNKDVEKALVQIKRRERLRRDYASIRRAYGISKQGLATLDVPDTETGGRQLITDATEIHDYLLKRNERHYSQATFTTFGDAGPGFQYINPDSPDSDQHIDAILEGTFEPWDSASPRVHEFLKELQCELTRQLDTTLHLADFIQLFRTIPENTASSVSGIHYGHYRVLSKLEDDTFIRVLFDLVNMAFQTQSPLPRWKRSTQLMLEKGKGPAIENLRIIQLLEADMNWLLRFLWGRKLDRHALEEGVYNDAQFASPGKLCISAILNKVIFFDILRQTRQYGALTDNDATAAFDRVLPALCVVTCRHLGMPKQAQRFFFKLLRQMEYSVTTAHGTSAKTYSATENPSAPGQGVIQGGGASLPNYKSQQLPVIKAYESNAVPAVFKHASGLRGTFRRWVSGFSDDISLFLNELGVKLSGVEPNVSMAQRMRNVLQSNLQHYEEYFFTSGGSLNLKKCFYYFIGFTWTGTAWRYKRNAEFDVAPVTITPTTLYGDAHPQEVQWCEANEAQRTLGSFIAPDGACTRQLEVLWDHFGKWKQCLRNISHSNLHAKWLSYTTVFLKKILYPLIGHSCTAADLQPMQQQIDREVLHLLCLNEHFPRAVLHAPYLFGGLGCATIHAQHVVEKLILFLHHIREQGQICETLWTSMSITQLECGVSTPFFSLSEEPWAPLVTPTWITQLWRECAAKDIQIRFHTELFWTPKAVREHDVCIMDIAANMFSGKQLLQINMCRVALKVIYLSDISTVDGKRILLSYYEGKPHKDAGRYTRLKWPPIGELPKSWWSLWQQFLQQWCGTALLISTPLGKWYREAEILTCCRFFLLDRRLLMQRNADEWVEFLPWSDRTRTRFRCEAFGFSELDLLDHVKVVDVTFRSASIYVIAQASPVFVEEASAPLRVQVFQDLYCDLSPDLQRLMGTVQWPAPHELLDIVDSIRQGTAVGVSDGSVRTHEGRASHAWIIHAANGCAISGMGPVDGHAEIRTSHRAELQGQTALFLMLSLILQYFRLVGSKFASYCDNQSVVAKMQHGWRLWRYRHTKGPDGDLQSLLRVTLNNLEKRDKLSYSSEWVQAHQDDIKNLQSLTRESTLNVQMDTMTKEAYHLPENWQTRSYIPVLKAEGCAVYLGNTKLSSYPHRTLLEHWHAKEAKEYLQQRHGFPTDTLDCIYWQSLRYALKKLSPHRRATAVKMIHRHLPTYAKLFQQGRVVMSSRCPRCVQSDETTSHIFCCPNLEAVKQRKADWLILWKELYRARTATIIERTWKQKLSTLLSLSTGVNLVDSLPAAQGDVDILLQRAVQEQDAIGWDKLLIGIGSQHWKALQDFIDSDNPHRPKRSASDWMNCVSHQLLKFSLRCWKQRNLTIHGSTRQEQRRISLQRARDRITQIYENPPPLAPQFRSIFAVPLDHRLKLPLQAAEQWISLIMHQAKVTSHNMRVLLNSHKPMSAHLRTMRREARNQAKDRRLPTTPRKAHSRAVQAAVKMMRERLYAPREKYARARNGRQPSTRRLTGRVNRIGSVAISAKVHSISVHPNTRYHPP